MHATIRKLKSGECGCRFVYTTGQLTRYGADILQADSAVSDNVSLQQLLSTLVSLYVLKPGQHLAYDVTDNDTIDLGGPQPTVYEG